jgi:hypothetical protein
MVDFTNTRGALGLIVAAAFASVAGLPSVAAETQRGTYTYFSVDGCMSAGKIPKEACANAARNASAEFEEKAPHFPTRAACEAAYRPGGCAVSFRQAPGAKGGVSFTPRQQGFRVMARSENDISTTPLSPGLNFSNRTAVRSAISIDPRAAGAAAPRPVANPDGGAGAVYGSSNPDGPKLPLPAPEPYDPNFDCSKYVEPSKDKNAGSGCLPGPAMKR